MTAGSILKSAAIFLTYVIPCIIGFVLVYLYVKPPKYIFRKLLHFVAFSSVTVTILKSESRLTAAAMFIVLAFIVYPILCMLEGCSWYSDLFVEKKPGEVKKSMVLLFVTIAVTAVLSPSDHVAAAAILMWGVGDAAAALIGIPFGRHVIPWRISDGKKTFEGTAAMFASALISGLIVFPAAGIPLSAEVIAAVITGAAVGAFTELVSKEGNDTVFVPAAILAVLALFGV